MIRNLTLAFLLSLLFATAHAQDVLVRKNGSTIEGKVMEVGVDKVLYKISKEADAANFAIRKNELLRIEFGNGQTIWFDRRAEKGRERVNARSRERAVVEYDQQFGRNKIDISPFKALDSGPGFGISYERILDKNGYFGLQLPLTVTLPESYYLGAGSEGSANDNMYYFSPTLKVYPFGQKRVTYAIGPTLYAGVGKNFNSYTNYDPSTGVFRTFDEERNRFRMGMIVNNFVNFQITPHFQIGLNGGVGPRYIDRETFGSTTYRNRGMNITGEFNFNLGFRF